MEFQFDLIATAHSTSYLFERRLFTVWASFQHRQFLWRTEDRLFATGKTGKQQLFHTAACNATYESRDCSHIRHFVSPLMRLKHYKIFILKSWQWTLALGLCASMNCCQSIFNLKIKTLKITMLGIRSWTIFCLTFYCLKVLLDGTNTFVHYKRTDNNTNYACVVRTQNNDMLVFLL